MDICSPERPLPLHLILLQLNLTFEAYSNAKGSARDKRVRHADREVRLELNRNYLRSALESDVRWYSENLSEDFYITAPDGALLNREAFLKRIANPYPGTEAEAVDVMIRILGDFAIIHSKRRAVGAPAAAPADRIASGAATLIARGGGLILASGGPRPSRPSKERRRMQLRDV